MKNRSTKNKRDKLSLSSIRINSDDVHVELGSLAFVESADVPSFVWANCPYFSCSNAHAGRKEEKRNFRAIIILQ